MENKDIMGSLRLGRFLLALVEVNLDFPLNQDLPFGDLLQGPKNSQTCCALWYYPVLLFMSFITINI